MTDVIDRHPAVSPDPGEPDPIIFVDPDLAEYRAWLAKQPAAKRRGGEWDMCSSEGECLLEASLTDLDESNAVRDFMYLTLAAAAEIEETLDIEHASPKLGTISIMRTVAEVARGATMLLSQLVVETAPGVPGSDDVLSDLFAEGAHRGNMPGADPDDPRLVRGTLAALLVSRLAAATGRPYKMVERTGRMFLA